MRRSTADAAHASGIDALVGTAEQLLRDESRLAAARSRQLGLAYERLLAEGASLTDSELDLALRSAAAEFATALRRSDRTMLGEMQIARSILRDFSAAQDAWEQGAIHTPHVRLIQRFGEPIDDAERRRIYEAAAVEAARELTPGRLRPVLQRLAEAAREVTLDERFAAASALRSVRIEDLEDGMSLLTALVPTVLAHAVYDRLTEGAKLMSAPAVTSRGADEAPALGSSSAVATLERSTQRIESRSFDAIRADLLCDLLLTSDPAEIVQRGDGGAPRIDARVSVTVPMLSLMGRSLEPAELVGVAPVPIDIARELAAEAPSLARILSDPITEAPIAIDRYRPSAAMRELLRVRDARCRFPGCRRRAERCDLDHTVDAALGGATSIDNLAHLCRRHHVLKHQTPWSVRQLDDGVLEWTSPSGRVVRDRPDRGGPSFTPDPDPPDPPPESKPPPF